MRPPLVLIYGATLVAAATLVLAGREVALRFTSTASVLDIAGPGLAAATSLICIGVLDWVRNLRRRSEQAEGMYEAAPQAPAPAPPSEAEQGVIRAIHELERLANAELGPDKALEEALQVLAEFAKASEITLWVTDESGAPKPRARYSEGRAVVGDNLDVGPADDGSLREVVAHHRPLEAAVGDGSSFLLPLLSGQSCFGVLRVDVPGVGAREGDAVQQLSARLGQVARHFARAVSAPDLYDRAVIDPLTGLYSKRHFINRLTEATGVSRRYGEPLSLALMDIDNFKMINSTYGDGTGDRVLRTTASLIQENIREVDTAYRYGPDEVAVILPDTEIDQACTFADRVRRVVGASRALADDGASIIASVSIGVAEFDEDMRGIGQLIACAEEALYAAKNRGRDRVERWHEPARPEAGEDTG